MKMLGAMNAAAAVALLMPSAPLGAAGIADEPSARSERQAEQRIDVTGRRICTRIERYGGSRISHARVCLTADEWRERLGADWRQQLAGRNSPQDDLEAVDARARTWSNIDGGGISTTGGGGNNRPPQ
jgi:hypothetical protein